MEIQLNTNNNDLEYSNKRVNHRSNGNKQEHYATVTITLFLFEKIDQLRR